MRKAGYELGEVFEQYGNRLKKRKSKRDWAEKDEQGYFKLGLWNTAIAEGHAPTGRVKLFSGGYHTNTTKERLNKLLMDTRQGGKIVQKNFDWFYERKGKKVPFREGMSFRF